MISASSLDDLLTLATDAAREGGRMAMAHFTPGGRTTAAVDYKAGGSPVTAADLAVDAHLGERLRRAEPDFGWLSEETADDPSRLDKRRVWIVDPIDGTRSFARGDEDWTVAIGLVEDGRPVLGAIYAPVTGDLFAAVRGGGATLNGRPIAVSARTEAAGARLLGPKPLVDAVIHEGGRFERAPRVHSLALRIAHVAAGLVDLGVAEAHAHDWDLAAAHMILTEAGGELRGRDGRVPSYNRPSTKHPAIAAGSPALLPSLAELLEAVDLRRVAVEDGMRRGR
jgi:myo-inositol-1(or 4)-monophosphatase